MDHEQPLADRLCNFSHSRALDITCFLPNIVFRNNNLLVNVQRIFGRILNVKIRGTVPDQNCLL